MIPWHAHEMLFGFVPAAVAGFLLTAVANWTGRAGYGGAPTVRLFAVWIAGRAAMALFFLVASVAAAPDLAFYLLLAATIVPSLVRAKARRNLPLPFVLGALFVADLLV